jgi:DNA-binding GntR family transcriptional regulator
MNKTAFLHSFENSETLTEKIHSSLEEAILEGKLKPNDRLVEEELSRTFKISRGPIREAFRLLERDGFIKIIPRKGAIVQEISTEDILDVYEIRSVLEGLAVRLACAKATDKELKKLEAIYEAMENLRKDTDTVRRAKKYKKLNREFHNTIIGMSKNKKIMDIYANFQKQIVWFQTVTLSVELRCDVSLREHKELLNCCLKRDADGAEKTARSHLENAVKIIMAEARSEAQGSTQAQAEQRR